MRTNYYTVLAKFFKSWYSHTFSHLSYRDVIWLLYFSVYFCMRRRFFYLDWIVQEPLLGKIKSAVGNFQKYSYWLIGHAQTIQIKGKGLIYSLFLMVMCIPRPTVEWMHVCTKKYLFCFKNHLMQIQFSYNYAVFQLDIFQEVRVGPIKSKLPYMASTCCCDLLSQLNWPTPQQLKTTWY